MHTTKGTTQNVDETVALVRARLAREEAASAAERVRQAPVIEQRRREREARKVVLLAELEKTLHDFVERMQATGYPRAKEYAVAETHFSGKGIFRIARTRFVPTVGWTIGLGLILLSDGRVCDGNFDSGNRYRERLDPFKNYANDMLEDLIDALGTYPDKD